jgi:hypothetical protein
MLLALLIYLLFSLPFAARVAWLSEWPCWSDGIAHEIFGGVALILFGPFFWVSWWWGKQP